MRRGSGRVTGPAADEAVVMLVVGGGLVLASLWAPWGRSTVGLLVADPTKDGWQWLTGGRDLMILAAGVLIAAVAVARSIGRQPSRAGLVGAGLISASLALLATVSGLRDREIVSLQGSLTVPIDFHSLTTNGPVVAMLGLILALGGLARASHPPPQRRPMSRRSVALLGAAALLVASTFMPWTYSGEAGVDPWELYDWADVGMVLVVAGIGLCAAFPPRWAFLALPVAAIVLPVIDAGDFARAPAGIRASSAQEGGPVRVGLVLALMAVLVAASALASAPGRRRRGVRALRANSGGGGNRTPN